ncbi:MAG: amino acid ABC transporter permease [Candidatus Bipolaricaulis sp.]|nr:amino acid ABC transporter permease [Candidatus Bipolaricaulis sp.]MDD5646562.1 amino acid ABC transporter permease [Candidatus Bipolaricaulis sp.]
MSSFAALAEAIPRLLDGLLVTLRLIAVSAPAGLALGLVVGLLQVYSGRFSRGLAGAYQLTFRGVPLIVQLFILYYGLPRVGITMTPFVAASLAFTLCSGAYHSEYVRSAVLSVPDGQMDAGRALGMSLGQTVIHIILPQVFRKALPGCSNEIVYLIKYSSLAYLVTLVDLTGEGRLIAYESFRFFETFLIVGLIYLALVSIAASFLRGIERWIRVPM